MRVIDRLQLFLNHRGIAPSAFEKECGIGNGYVGKQMRGKGGLGSEVVEKIAKVYPDLGIDWLITGEGPMLKKRKTLTAYQAQLMREDAAIYKVRSKVIALLRQQLLELENTMPGATFRKRKQR